MSNEPNKTSRQRRRRPRNRRKQKQRDEALAPVTQVVTEQPNLDLNDLTSEARALEKQLAELQTQLKINYSSLPSKEQGRMASVIAAEQISATEEEIEYVRRSLKRTYQRIFSLNLVYATSHHIEEKIWRYIFYASIEQVRSKLRKMKSAEDMEAKVQQKVLLHRIDAALKFYRELNHQVKTQHHIDTKVLGIDLFKQNSRDDEVAILLQFNYICMGDLARYHAQQAMTVKSSKKTAEYWAMAKSCYLKAIDVNRKNGKPYSQLALVSISNGNAIDVVWYYCMSLAVKQPSQVGRDNLKSFYSKIRFNSKSKHESPTGLLSQFVESFLHMHSVVMFNQKDTEEFTNMLSSANQLGTAISALILTQGKEGDDTETISKSTSSLLHITRTTLTRSITILLISIWIAGERLKDKANFNHRSLIISSQIHMYTYGFHLLTNVIRSIRQSLDQIKDNVNAIKYEKLDTLLEETLLPGLSIWSTFLYTNMTPFAQYCIASDREPEKKTLVKSIQSLLLILISHSSFPDPVLNVLPPTYPLSEDLSLLGIIPLDAFHSKVDFFKETIQGDGPRQQVRWGRIRDWVKKLADTASFDFIQYNQTEQKYSVIDENAKRQQQSRFMKALATQRLMEQVSSLEKNVNRMTMKQPVDDIKKEVYTCVVDVTAFLDGLAKVKKWASQTLNVDCRSQASILEVVVPLEVIDALDDHKKGTSHMNMQARESIRFLDQKLLQSNNKTETTPSTSWLRTQKINEKLDSWSDAKMYWIGEESRSKVVDQLLSEEEEDEKETSGVSDDDSDNSDGDLFHSRRRGRDSESEEDVFSSEEEEDDEEVVQADEELDYDQAFEEEDDEPYTCNDVPKSYRAILSCLLYYHSIQKSNQDNQPERLVLVTNDEDLAWWAELFGDPKTGKRLLVKTVNEWDQMVGKIDFEKVYAYSWKQR